jgi:hypothetical protein
MRRFMRRLFAALLAASCAPPQPPPRATWHKDVRPIVDRRCIGCHTEGGIAPFSLQSYTNAQIMAPLMLEKVSAREMPPWPPDPDCGPPLTGSRRLTDSEIATIVAWVEDGAKEGNPEDAPAPLSATEEFVGDLVIDPGVEYTPPEGESDDYHCFPVDPGLTRAADVVGYNVRPGDRGAVHHVILYSIEDAGDVARVDALDAETPEPGFTCFGGPGVDWAFTIAGWVPGSGATWFPDGVGVRIPATARLVIQVHYNQLERRGQPDRTVVELATTTLDVDRVYIIPIPDMDFVVPAGAVKKTSVSYESPVPATAFGVIPHMHLLGREIEARIERADGTSECVHRIRAWDFHWQQFYFFTTPVQIAEGERIRLSCTFDNTAENQPVVNGVRQPPRTVTWGDRTLDEMCLMYFMATAGAPVEP